MIGCDIISDTTTYDTIRSDKKLSNPIQSDSPSVMPGVGIDGGITCDFGFALWYGMISYVLICIVQDAQDQNSEEASVAV